MKYAYPVFFTKSNNIILIEVPDMDILTEGKDMIDAIEMSRDAIGLKGISFEDDNIKVPEPSNIDNLDTEKATFAQEGKTYIVLVDIDFEAYRRKMDNKTIRRNVTLPNWLNQEAEKANINVSRVLQEALMKYLNVSR